MIRSLWSAASGMLAQQMNVDVIANNLANVNTPGFKKSRVEFQDMLYQNIRLPQSIGTGQDARTVGGLDVGLGVRPVATLRQFSAGNLQPTDNPNDLSVLGNGFFVVSNGQQQFYTRAGNFNLDSQGNLVTPEGYRLMNRSNQPIKINLSAGNVERYTVGQDGTVSVTLTNGTVQAAGQVGLATFTNPSGLIAMGQNLYQKSPASGEPKLGNPGAAGFGTLAQSSLETSNVQVVEEMVNLIVAQRAYEINSKAVQSSDDMLGIANSLRR